MAFDRSVIVNELWIDEKAVGLMSLEMNYTSFMSNLKHEFAFKEQLLH